MNENTDLNELVSLASRILSELELLTSATKAASLNRFQSDFLATEQQCKIYEEINGERDSQAIADAAGASLRAVQLIIKDLMDKDLINVTKKARSNIPSKSTAKIATYYAKLDIENVGGVINE